MMRERFRDVADHEEFLGMVEDSETGLYAAELWNLHSYRRNKPVSSANVARKAFKALYEREGWDQDLMMVTPGISLGIVPGDEGTERRRSQAKELSGIGFWWATMPFGYWEGFDDEEAHVYSLNQGGLHVALWAYEYTARVLPKKVPQLPEFEYQSEYARKGRLLYHYDSSPEAPRSKEELADLRTRWAREKPPTE
jgi:hypothetical protein